MRGRHARTQCHAARRGAAHRCGHASSMQRHAPPPSRHSTSLRPSSSRGRGRVASAAAVRRAAGRRGAEGARPRGACSPAAPVRSASRPCGRPPAREQHAVIGAARGCAQHVQYDAWRAPTYGRGVIHRPPGLFERKAAGCRGGLCGIRHGRASRARERVGRRCVCRGVDDGGADQRTRRAASVGPVWVWHTHVAWGKRGAAQRGAARLALTIAVPSTVSGTPG